MPVGRPPAFDVLIAFTTWAGVMPFVRLTVAPLRVNVPVLTRLPGKPTAPVSDATASGSSVAPVPVIFAAAGAPANGLAMKSAGLINSDLGTLTLCAAVSG